MSGEETLLAVKDLAVHFFTDEGVVRAVDGVSLNVNKGRTLGVVGESGCGKSVTALSVLRLIPEPPGRIVAGEISFQGENLLALPAREMRRVRGNSISMIFQEPMTSLNPVFTIGNQIAEAVLQHQDVSRARAWKVAGEMLARVRIPEPEMRLGEYPHQLSGGMKQRAMIAMALACRPALLIADEPTTALDVTIQAQILALINELQRELGMAVILITHDLGVIAETADEVAVMYAGRVVEYAAVRELFDRPGHPYMVNLFRSRPVIGRAGEKLSVIPGQVPDPRRYPPGCRFHPRCDRARPECAQHDPELQEISPGHQVACLRVPGYRLPAGVAVAPLNGEEVSR